MTHFLLSIGTVGAVRVMRVEYDHYSKMCRSNKCPPLAAKDHPTYIEEVEACLRSMEEAIVNRRTERKKLQEAFEAQQRQKDEEERERIRQAKKGKAKASKFWTLWSRDRERLEEKESSE